MTRTLAALAAAVGLAVAVPATAHAAGAPIACWVPQHTTFHVLTDAELAGARNVDQAGYQAWRTSSVRQRPDGRYEVLMRSDTGSAPWCTELLPGLWVAHEDVPAVRAYLTALAEASNA